MELLFKREQSNANSGGVNFKLWGKIELDEDEQAIVKRYKFDNAILIEVDQPGLLRKSIFVAVVVLIIALVLFNSMGMMGALLALAAAGGGGYFYYHQYRETLYVKDLLHGRNFVCASIVDLAKKEEYVAGAVSFLRQVMESAKHWDGTVRNTVDPLPKEEARQFIVRYG